jgi:hypothetical protein
MSQSKIESPVTKSVTIDFKYKVATVHYEEADPSELRMLARFLNARAVGMEQNATLMDEIDMAVNEYFEADKELSRLSIQPNHSENDQ